MKPGLARYGLPLLFGSGAGVGASGMAVGVVGWKREEVRAIEMAFG